MTIEPRLVIIVPTRNRPDLALRAARSAISQMPSQSLVVVSDNSSDPSATDQLRVEVEALRSPNLLLLQPSEDLAMPAHWQWVMDQVELVDDWTHATVLTDRMVYKHGALEAMMRAIRLRPDRVVTFNHDTVDDTVLPARAHCAAWTGHLLEVQAERLLALSAELVLHSALPRMLNCAVPRSHIATIRARFGQVFASVAPDMYFAYRTLEVVDSIYYLDRSLLIHSALSRSNGASYSRGEATPDQRDFMAKLGGLEMNHGAPVPAFRTTCNTCVSEYELARTATGSSKFPEIDERAYLDGIEREIKAIMDPSLRAEMTTLLDSERGKRGARRSRTALVRRLRHPGRSACALIANVASHPMFARLWLRDGVAPPRTRWLEFPDAEAAVAFADNPGRRVTRGHDSLRVLNATMVRANFASDA